MLAAAPAWRGSGEPLGNAEPLGDGSARAAGDRLRADLRELAGAGAVGLEQRKDVRRDRERQHAVAEEREPLV